ncbi:MAG: bifunctional 4-hydroxy-2-oxoglutarate aldolase/2-dehydro-3-deoxy-phosphogluconate aldolase [Treponema sp.]|jgi:2-dehydro-3-deoxyphosphogluconate aldolase/(4S)-4-hydroxy-2-oxoglutarate aldolase|nr:bifunctional 4-hydroxy-2-oxoglutarate aldolase/2-dehydro-3-deoxy-phosphogluconate aldolase [Treponema sp.]
MNKILEELGKIGIVPVIKIDDVEKAVPLARALIAGGIPAAEVTFRTAQGEEAIRRINRETPGILLGAGTVLTTEQVDRAIGAGAKFIVSPGLNPKVTAYCIDKGIPITPGCSNPSDIERALELGLEVVKFFPAEQSGGLEYIKAIAAPYTTVQFMPTGGINAGNIAKYIAYEKILACGGSWMVSADLINAGDFDRIAALCREAVMNMLGLSMVHLGINTGSSEEADKAANLFRSLFGFPYRDGAKSIFAGDAIEVMKSPGPGEKGHIAIGTNSVFRAVAWLERQGIPLNRESAKYDAKGALTLMYLKDEIAGFAVHLVQKK